VLQFHIEVTEKMVREWTRDINGHEQIENQTVDGHEEYLNRAISFYEEFFAG
jgi:hypothetical protein